MNDFTVQLKNSFCPDYECTKMKFDFEKDVRPMIENPSKLLFETFSGETIDDVANQLKEFNSIKTANYILYKIVTREDYDASNLPITSFNSLFSETEKRANVKWGHSTSSGQNANVVVHLLLSE